MNGVVESLRRACRGVVLTEDAEGFFEAVRGHNHTSVHDPDVVVQAAGVADVAATVLAAADHGVQVQVQSTGHGPSRVTRGGILLRTSALNDIQVDPVARSARVGAGVVWDDLVAVCGEHGLAPLGMASAGSVGVAGYLLGGGMGPLGRTEGFGADHVLAIEMIDGNGQPRTIDAEHSPDLFWALRGGRLVPGVITTFTLQLGHAPELFAANLTYDRADAPTALRCYATWQRDLPDSVTTMAGLLRFPDHPALPETVRGRRFMQITMVHAGSEASGRATLALLTAEAAPTTADSSVTDPAGWMRAQRPIPPGPSWQRGLLLDKFDPDVADAVGTAVGLETEGPWQIVEIRPMGGALGRPPAVANAVGGRSNGVVLSTVASAPDESGNLSTLHAQLAQRMRPWTAGALHVNFHGHEDATHPLSAAWSRHTYDRLADVRAVNDPTGLFPAPLTSLHEPPTPTRR